MARSVFPSAQNRFRHSIGPTAALVYKAVLTTLLDVLPEGCLNRSGLPHTVLPLEDARLCPSNPLEYTNYFEPM